MSEDARNSQNAAVFGDASTTEYFVEQSQSLEGTPGKQGLAGADGKPGIGATTDAWNSQLVYQPGDHTVWRHSQGGDGANYRCLQASQGVPPTGNALSGAYWQLFTEGGENGTDGQNLTSTGNFHTEPDDWAPGVAYTVGACVRNGSAQWVNYTDHTSTASGQFGPPKDKASDSPWRRFVQDGKDGKDSTVPGQRGPAGRDVNPRGQWGSDKTYDRLDEVRHETSDGKGATWVCLADNTTSEPDSGSGDWQLVAGDGKDGKDGTNGTNGTDGQDGTNGTDGQDGKDGKDALPYMRFSATESGSWRFVAPDEGETIHGIDGESGPGTVTIKVDGTEVDTFPVNVPAGTTWRVDLDTTDWHMFNVRVGA